MRRRADDRRVVTRNRAGIAAAGVRRRLPALALLGPTVCDGPALSLEVGGSSCVAIALETVEPSRYVLSSVIGTL